MKKYLKNVSRTFTQLKTVEAETIEFLRILEDKKARRALGHLLLAIAERVSRVGNVLIGKAHTDKKKARGSKDEGSSEYIDLATDPS